MLAATFDPDGRRVVLDEGAWRHIKRRHPPLARRQAEIMTTVREPEHRQPGRWPEEVWYFSEHSGGLPWLQVVVHYEGDAGWIVTAFPCTAPRGR